MITITPRDGNTAGHALWSVGAAEDTDTAAEIVTDVDYADRNRLVIVLRPVRQLAYISRWFVPTIAESHEGKVLIGIQKSTEPGSGLDADAGPPAQIEVETFLLAL